MVLIIGTTTTHHAKRFEGNLNFTSLPIKFDCELPRPCKIESMENMISKAYNPTENLIPYSIEISGVKILHYSFHIT